MACTNVLPPVSFNDSCPTAKRGQIYRLYHTLAGSTHNVTDFGTLTNWTARLDQSTAYTSGVAKIRRWDGLGDMPAGDQTDVDMSLERVKSFPGNKVINFKVDDMSDANIAAAIAIKDAGGAPAKIWPQADDLLYGGDSGIDGTLKADIIVPESRTDLQYIQLTFTFKGSLGEAVTTPHSVL